MKNIVCMIRGGEVSRRVQVAAIERAKESGATLTFLYVVDLRFLPAENKSLQHAGMEEMSWVGYMVLDLAKRRGENAGISPKTALLHGFTTTTVTQFLRDQHADLLLLGAPHNEEQSQQLHSFAKTIQNESNVQVEVVEYVATA